MSGQAVANVSIPIPRPAYRPVGFARHRIKITVGIYFLVLAAEVARGWTPLNPLDWSNAWVIAGSVCNLLGLFLRSWAAGLLTKKKRLAMKGPYSLVRHPLYAGSILLMIGFSILTGSVLNLVLTLGVALLAFGSAIASEEPFLASKFGRRWTDYISRTGPLWPRWRSLFDGTIARRISASWSFQKWLGNREYNAWLGSTGGWLAICLWYAWSQGWLFVR